MDRCVFAGPVLPQDKDEGIDGFQSLRGDAIVREVGYADLVGRWVAGKASGKAMSKLFK